jgi:hypothetical protein
MLLLLRMLDELEFWLPFHLGFPRVSGSSSSMRSKSNRDSRVECVANNPAIGLMCARAVNLQRNNSVRLTKCSSYFREAQLLKKIDVYSCLLIFWSVRRSNENQTRYEEALSVCKLNKKIWWFWYSIPFGLRSGYQLISLPCRILLIAIYYYYAGFLANQAVSLTNTNYYGKCR